MIVWSEHVFQYCERGHSTLFWAEPLNAASNAAFLVAGGFCVTMLMSRPRAARHACSIVLTGLLFAIAIGSFLFHTLATPLAELGDQASILCFVLVYLAFALRLLLGLSRGATVLGVAAFAIVAYLASRVECPPASGSAPAGIGDSTCLWGSFAYLPALLAIWSTVLILRRRGHQAVRPLLAATAIFTVSLAVRTLDVPLCDVSHIASVAVGTHFVWHILNAITLALLVRTAIVQKSNRPLVRAHAVVVKPVQTR